MSDFKVENDLELSEDKQEEINQVDKKELQKEAKAIDDIIDGKSLGLENAKEQKELSNEPESAVENEFIAKNGTNAAFKKRLEGLIANEANQIKKSPTLTNPNLTHSYSSNSYTSGQRPHSFSNLSLKDLVDSLLRPSENCLIGIEVKYTRSSGLREDRMIAVVVNRDEGVEEGCVFLLKRNGPRSTTIRRTLPIFSDFRLALSQSKPVDLNDNASISASKSELSLKLSSNKKEISVDLTSGDQLQSLVAELKRLSTIAVNQAFRHDGISHSWVKYYAVIEQPASPSHTRANTFSNPMSPLSPFAKGSEIRNINEVINPLVMASPNLIGDGLSLEAENATRLKAIKEEWVAKEMRAREAQFTTYDHINIFVGTWNVNGKYANQSLSPWLLNYGEKVPDLYILGFQELDLSAEAFLMNDSLREVEWCASVMSGLGELGSRYIKLISKQLVGIFLVIYVLEEHRDAISDVTTDSAGVGILGMMGNKGAVAVRFRFRDSYFCIVNSHLAADSSQIDRRNQDFQDICRRVGFPEPPPIIGPNGTALPLGYNFTPSPVFKTEAMSLPRNPKFNSIFDSDHLIWLGDLNYRISLTSEQVLTRLKESDYDYLLKYDQLKLQQSANKVFVNFKEGPIQFAPTYKYDVGTNQFDSSEKKRIPSWCDRILWKSMNGDKEGVMDQLSYTSCMDLTSSDHKPVLATFRSQVKTLLLDRFQEVHANLIRELDKFENQIMPDAKISTNQLNFGEVNYLNSKELSISIENTGKVYLQFEFIPKMEETTICKPWLWVNPPNGMIMPNEKLQVNFILMVDRKSAPPLNMGEDRLEDILILHLVKGKDYFVSISGEYLPTCFAVPLEYLARLPRPIRQMSIDSDLNAVENSVSVPYVIWRMGDFIYQYGIETENLFLSPGTQEMMVYIRECLDTGHEFDLAKLLIDSDQAPPPMTELNTHDLAKFFEPPPIDPIGPSSHIGIHSMAESLIRFLEALPTPVIPYHLYDACLEAAVIGKEAATQALETLPRIHLNVFIYIVSLIREVVAHAPPEDYLLVEKLAVVFSSVLLRSDKEDMDDFADQLERKKWFLLLFLVDNDMNI